MPKTLKKKNCLQVPKTPSKSQWKKKMLRKSLSNKVKKLKRNNFDRRDIVKALSLSKKWL